MDRPPPPPTPPSVLAAKATLRRWARTLLPPSREASDAVLAALFEALSEQGRGSRASVVGGSWSDSPPVPGVLLYLSLPGEIAVERLRDRLAVSLFATRTPEAGPLTIHCLDPGTPLEQHRLGFWQPAADAPTAPLDALGTVLVPGLAFDRRGGRLGRGRGHYDTLLARLPGRRFVGVTQEAALVDEVPREPHDVLMTHLVTEAGLRPVDPYGSSTAGP